MHCRIQIRGREKNMKDVIYIPDYDGPGLYKIVNKDNGKLYIGSSQNIKNRALQHFTMLECGNLMNCFVI